jgi:polysaccharide export outer membrane protein
MALSAAWLLARAPTAAQGSAPQPAAPVDSSYVIQRGDELSIKVFGRPELDDTVTVRNDGRISALLIDDLDAAGLTPRQLVAALTERYEKFFRAPQVNAIVRRAAALKVFVGGEVAQPGAIPIVGDLTALAAVYQAGGFTRAARTDSVVLLRDSHGDKPLTLRLDLKKLDLKDSGTALQARDVIYVPASRIAKVDRFVDEYVRQLIPISLTAGFSYVMGPGFSIKP